MKKTQNLTVVEEQGSFIDLIPGKRYKGSGMVMPSGDFHFRKYYVRSKEEKETFPDERLVSEDENCQIWKYKDKITLKINIPLQGFSEVKVFAMLAKHVKFINNYLFTLKNIPRK